MGFFLTYLKEHFECKPNGDYDVVPAFRASQFCNQTTAEKEFVKDLKKIALWSPSNLQRWAVIQQKGLSCLQKITYSEYWKEVLVKQTLQAETSALYSERRKEAESYLLNQGSSSSENYEEAANDEESSVDISFPSDLTIDHHPLAEDDMYSFLTLYKDDDIPTTVPWIYSLDSKNNNSCFDVINELKVFSSVSLKLDPKGLSDLRLLSLNYIYLFSLDPKKSITSYFSHQIHERIMRDLLVEPVVPMTDRCVLWSSKVSQVRLSNWFQVQKTTIPILNEAMNNMDENPEELIIANVLHRAALLFSSKTLESELEDSYVHNFIGNLFDNIFRSDGNLEFNWANGTLGGKRKYNEEINGFKPDYVIFISQRSSRLDLACAEVKPPTSHNMFPKSDLVKIGQEMRWMLNTLIREGLSCPVVGGVLISGFDLFTYKMDLIENGVYRMTELGKSPVFQNLQSLILVPSLVSNLLQLKEITLSTASKSKDCLQKKSKGLSPVSTTPLSWLRDECIDLVKRRKKE